MRSLLIVEDEPLEMIAVCGNVKRIYEDQFRILKAEDGVEALEICEKEKPDILLVDINIPRISGLELIEALKEKKYDGKILIITAYDVSGYVRKALEMGVIGYLLKPIHAKELQEAVDKCIRLLEAEQEQKKRESSHAAISFFAEQYLVKNILEGSFPKDVLRNAYEWPEDGHLSVSVIVFSPGTKLPDGQEATLHLVNEQRISRYFYIISASEGSSRLFFLQSRFQEEEDKLLVILQVCAQAMWKQFGQGSMIVSNLLNSYEQLFQTSRGLLEKIPKKKGFWMEKTAADTLYDKTMKQKICRKWEQRLREGKAKSFVQIFRRRVSSPNLYWGCVSLFLLAFSGFDNSVDEFILLDLFMEEKPYKQFERWLEEYYQRKKEQILSKTDKLGMIDYALAWMEEYYSEDISREMISEKLGLSETYFSHLFKQKTNQSFVAKLSEIRIRHAVEMLDSGMTDLDEISKACGYNNKKYFAEVFKRFTGCRITDYQKGKQDEK